MSAKVIRWAATAAFALAWASIATGGPLAPEPTYAQSTIDFTIEVSGSTVTVEAYTGFPDETVRLKLWYREAGEDDVIYACDHTGREEIDVELQTDAGGWLDYTATNAAITEANGVDGCVTARGISHWAGSIPLISISPALDTIDLRIGVPTEEITITVRTDSSDTFSLQATRGASITVDDRTYTGDSSYSVSRRSNSATNDTVVFTVTPRRTTEVGFTVWRVHAPFQNYRITQSRNIPTGTPVPTPTVSTDYADEVDLRVESGPGQIVATFEICCFRTYLLELRDIRTQAKLLQWSYVSEGTGSQYIAPPAVFANLDSGTEYGVCLYTLERSAGGPGSRSQYSGNYLCYSATTDFPTPTPPVPTPTAAMTDDPTPTPTLLPAGLAPNLFRTPTPVGGVVQTQTPVPTAEPAPLPTPTPWDETLLYTNTAPGWETAPQVKETIGGNIEILVQWTTISDADYYELLITDGFMAGRTDRSADAVLREHTWMVIPSSEPSRVRVRAVKQGSPYAALVSNVDNNRVVIPAGQTAYSPFSSERLISTNINTLVEEVSPTKYADSPIGAFQGRHGGELHGFGFWLSEQLGTGPATTWVFAQSIWLTVCMLVMVAVMAGVGKATGGMVGPWPFAAGMFFFGSMWTGMGGAIAGLEPADRFLPIVVIGFVGFLLVRGRGWIG